VTRRPHPSRAARRRLRLGCSAVCPTLLKSDDVSIGLAKAAKRRCWPLVTRHSTSRHARGPLSSRSLAASLHRSVANPPSRHLPDRPGASWMRNSQGGRHAWVPATRAVARHDRCRCLASRWVSLGQRRLGRLLTPTRLLESLAEAAAACTTTRCWARASAARFSAVTLSLRAPNPLTIEPYQSVAASSPASPASASAKSCSRCQCIDSAAASSAVERVTVCSPRFRRCLRQCGCECRRNVPHIIGTARGVGVEPRGGGRDSHSPRYRASTSVL
jgi:hypothetical protein